MACCTCAISTVGAVCGAVGVLAGFAGAGAATGFSTAGTTDGAGLIAAIGVGLVTLGDATALELLSWVGATGGVTPEVVRGNLVAEASSVADSPDGVATVVGVWALGGGCNGDFSVAAGEDVAGGEAGVVRGGARTALTWPAFGLGAGSAGLAAADVATPCSGC